MVTRTTSGEPTAFPVNASHSPLAATATGRDKTGASETKQTEADLTGAEQFTVEGGRTKPRTAALARPPLARAAPTRKRGEAPIISWPAGTALDFADSEIPPHATLRR